MSTVADTLVAIAQALEPLTEEIPGLQVYAGLNPNPTPPSIDVYPGDPFQNGAGFGPGNKEVFFTIRARVSTADHESGNALLLRLMEPTGATSVEAAVQFDDTAAVINDGGISGFREYLEDTTSNGRLLGCEWRVRTFL